MIRRYALLLILAGALALLATPWAGLDSLIHDLGKPGAAPAELLLTALAVAAVGTGLLTLDYTGRPRVTLLILPVALALAGLGAAAAVLSAALGALAGHALRRTALVDALAGAGRVLVPVCVGIGGGWLISPVVAPLPVVATPLSLARVAGWGVQALVLAAAADAADAALRVVERRWVPGVWQPAGMAMQLDPLTNLIAVPVIVALEAAGSAFGLDRLAAVITGMLGLLIVVRGQVNLRTFDEALAQAHAVVSGEREKLARLFASSGEGIYTVDRDLRITSVNPAMLGLLQEPPGQLLGHRCPDACRYEDLHGVTVCPDRCPLLRAHREGEPVSEELVYHAGDGESKHLQLTYSAVTDASGALELGIAVARDVTAEREAERLREEFVSLVTHELRSPLTASLGNLELMRRALHRSDTGEQLDTNRMLTLVDRVTDTERHLVQLVNNLLDLARVERTDLPLEYEVVRVGEAVERELEALEGQAAAKRLTMGVDCPAGTTFRTSGLYLRQILGNLVANAVKYTAPGGRVDVRIAEAAAPGGAERGGAAPSGTAAARWLEVTVRDTGYGISEQDQARLFSRFFRSGRPEIRQERGTGLGLALTKQLVDRLGGTILVHSRLGVGSTFTVRLPEASAAGPDAAAPRPDSRYDAAATPRATA